jgi:hypothetical protein
MVWRAGSQYLNASHASMSKPIFGMILGGTLGVIDGLSALVSAPETRPQIAGIVIGSTIKGLLVGLIIGYFARKVRSPGAVIAFGVVASAFFAFLIAQMQHKYYLEIILPGSIVGLIVGYAAQRHQEVVT